jgi:hypothetical protein
MRLGVVRSISYGLWGPPGEFVPQARGIGAGLVRVYVYWNQVEPASGEYDWTVVDALLAQLGDEEVWVTVCASSTWATREATPFLPPSPPKNHARYAAFVRALVERCGGRVTYWQCENEPSNTPLLWSGTAQEYAVLLRTMHDAVKAADPAAQVVLGGCGLDVWSSPPDSEPRRFFHHVLATAGDCFDLFSVHLYDEAVATHVADARAMLAEHGLDTPLVAGEIGGPVPLEFPELMPVIGNVMAQGGTERDAVLALYAADLPDRMRMFLVGCPPELEEKRHRIACRQLVTRTLAALAEGVRRTFYWHLAPETPGDIDPYQIMGVLFGKLALFAYEGRDLTHRHPAADTFALLAAHLADAISVTRIDNHAVRIDGQAPALVVWAPGDPFDGEDAEPVPADLPWPAATAHGTDVFGAAVQVSLADGRVRFARSVTPVFVTV